MVGVALVGRRVARSDFLQAGFTRMCAESHVAQEQADAAAREAGERQFEHR